MGGDGKANGGHHGLTAKEAAELAEVQQRLAKKKDDVSQLKQQLAKAEAEKDAIKTACAAGFLAAKTQMHRLRTELAKVKQKAADEEAMRKAAIAAEQNILSGAIEGEVHADENAAAMDPTQEGQVTAGGTDAHNPAVATAPATAEDVPPAGGASAQPAAAPKAVDPRLTLEIRAMRHELARFQHLAESLEASRPQEEAQIMQLKAQLTHTHDVVESTRCAMRHHEIDRELKRQSGVARLGEAEPSAQSQEDEMMAPKKLSKADEPVSLLNGGHNAVEAHGEKCLRAKAEERNEHLTTKSKHLLGIVTSQQLLIQRLEKALIKDEAGLGQKTQQLAYENHRSKHLKGRVRQCSDDTISAALGCHDTLRFNKGYTSADASMIVPSTPPHNKRGPVTGRGTVDGRQDDARTYGGGVPFPDQHVVSESASCPQLPPIGAAH